MGQTANSNIGFPSHESYLFCILKNHIVIIIQVVLGLDIHRCLLGRMKGHHFLISSGTWGLYYIFSGELYLARKFRQVFIIPTRGLLLSRESGQERKWAWIFYMTHFCDKISWEYLYFVSSFNKLVHIAALQCL